MTEVVIITIIVLAIIMVFFVIYKLKSTKLPDAIQQKIQKSWQHIKQLQKHEEAILEADKLLDYVMSKRGYSGNLGNKLKNSGSLFSDLNNVWYAHKLRNQIAHELHHKISENEYNKAMRAFEKALRDLGCNI